MNLFCKQIFVSLFAILALLSCRDENNDPPVSPATLQMIRARAGNTTLSHTQITANIPVNSVFFVEFSSALDTASVRKSLSVKNIQSNDFGVFDLSFTDENKTAIVTPSTALSSDSDHVLTITSGIKGSKKESFPGIAFQFRTEQGILRLQSATLNGEPITTSLSPRNVAYNNISLVLNFSSSLDPVSYQDAFSFYPQLSFNTALSADRKTVTLTNNEILDYYRRYSFHISSNLIAENGFTFNGFLSYFRTGLNPSNKMPLISDDALLTLVQQHTFRYFWDFAHPVSGLARERNTSGETVTTGGSGFGLMSILVGIERNFINRNEGIERLNKIIDFLTIADRFHGAWPHWLNGSTGAIIPFSTKDNGGDLVETSFMAAGLLTVRQYLDNSNPLESSLIAKINSLLDGIEWSWYTRGGQNVLYWHWSPNFGWDMNMQIRGYNEALITYFMAATSTTFPIDAQVYHQGWANSGGIINGKSFYGIQLPLGYDYGGPLFFAHYSFLGLNPVNLSDQYANYWDQNRNHSLINREHCVVNPFNRTGYSADCWGLTASDDPAGYRVHEPTSSRDNGTISPTAALSSMPFTTQESIQAMRHFYYILGDKLWGQYGFYDAFNPDQGWWANSYLAIDQGPIIVMIENYRSGLIWNLFMSAPEVQLAMQKLGFSN